MGSHISQVMVAVDQIAPVCAVHKPAWSLKNLSQGNVSMQPQLLRGPLISPYPPHGRLLLGPQMPSSAQVAPHI
jgi:hypothetical protein